MFNKNKLSAAIVALAAGGSSYAVAQENPIVEEVVVTGIRASIEKAMDIKRDASGVVDAIAAEDIGKFPDANLAESLQRIPGVSINRNAGEGNTVTVRGFSAEYNMVTLNGRQMPSSNDGRSFNFNDLAAELVNGVEVYKTSSASRVSGGIGAVINVSTARPLDIGTLRLAGSVKGVSDTDEGSVTPEISGLVSNVFADGTIGALLAVSYQQRKYEQERLAIDGWRVNQNINRDNVTNPEVLDRVANTFIAQNYNISVQETERERTNANLVFQFAPNDDLTVTADYVYSNLSVDAKSSQLGVWFNAGDVENVTLNENGTVIDMYENGTFDNIQNWYETVSENNSFGLNIDWQVSDNFNLVFDANMAKSEQNPGGEFNQYQGIVGYGNQQRLQILPGSELPALTEIGWDPDRGRPQAPFCGNGNWNQPPTQGQQNCLDYADQNGIDPNGVATGPDVAGGIAQELLRAHRNDIQSENTVDEINQFRLEGLWTDGAVDLRAGVMFIDQTKNNRLKYNAHEPRNVVEQYAGFFGFPVLSESLVSGRTRVGNDFLDQFKGNEILPREWVYYDPSAYFAEIWPAMGEGYSQIPTEWSPNSYEIQEETLATYIQANLESEFLNKPLRVEGGVRLESTTTTSSGFEQTLVSLRFTDPTSMAPVYAEGGARDYSEDSSYDVLLPNISLRWDLTDDIVTRFSAGRTIARPDINNLTAVRTIGDTRPQGAMTASSGNPKLKPYSADNLDVGVEWYYSDLSYASVGYFWKSINDFIVGGTGKETINDVTDPSSNGGDIDNPTDPADADVAVFDVSRPVNGPTARVEGLELAVQHTFGETGFGVSANATFVTTNRDLVKEDVDNRFAVVGVSDSVNLVGFYEQGPFQARLAYNWRDSFLNCFCQLQGGDAVVVEDYGQWDLTLGYDLTDEITLQFEGTNITGEGYRSHARYKEQLYEAISTGPRVAIGIRASF